MFARRASSAMDSCACFFVPTNRTLPPSDEMSRVKAYASSTLVSVCCRSMMWIPLRSMKMKRFIFGFQRRAWCPKWTPDSSSCFIVTTGMASFLPCIRRRPREHPVRASRGRGPSGSACEVPAFRPVRYKVYAVVLSMARRVRSASTVAKYDEAPVPRGTSGRWEVVLADDEREHVERRLTALDVKAEHRIL